MKKSTIGLIIGLIIVIAGASIGYNALKDKDEAQKTSELESRALESVQDEDEGQAEDSEEKKSEEQKFKAPDFTVFDKEGKQVKFSDFKGKPAVINFWASWCSFCKVEMPDFQNVYDKYKDENIVFMMVAGTDGQRETRESADKYLESNSYTLPIYYDEALVGRDNLDILESANAAYMVSGYPSTVFVDSDGYLVGIYTGALDEGRLTKVVDFIMDEANNGKSLEEAFK